MYTYITTITDINKIYYFILISSYLPKLNYIMIGSLTTVSLSAIIFRFCVYLPVIEPCIPYVIPTKNKQPYILSLKIKNSLSHTSSNINKSLQINVSYKNQKNDNIQQHIVSSEKNLYNILTLHAINRNDISILLKQYPILQNLKIGQSISWESTLNGYLQRLVWNNSNHEIHIYHKIHHGFKENITSNIKTWKNIILTGQLIHSFIASAHIAGLNKHDINIVIKALQWQLDFKKLQTGDQFSFLISKKMLLNNGNTKSQLIGIHLRTKGKDYYAFRAGNGRFYNRDATGLMQNFIRFPILHKFRVSSNFNLHRLNPITGKIVPHRGVDFAVPIGTPVLAVSDGEVIVSKKDHSAGNYVTIRHNHQYITRYMHLKKILVKSGQKVKCGEYIALSGNTGRSTGPHLHYEVWVNQKAVNPLTIQWPYADKLSGNNRLEYLNYVNQIISQF